MHGHWDARPSVTFQATEHDCLLTSTKLYCLVIGAPGCEQLAQSSYAAVPQLGAKPFGRKSEIQSNFNVCHMDVTLFEPCLFTSSL